jgi:hypothetical protein
MLDERHAITNDANSDAAVERRLGPSGAFMTKSS